jgi:hypothetical protein
MDGVAIRPVCASDLGAQESVRVSAVLKAALRDRIIGTNPAEGVRCPSGGGRPVTMHHQP